MSSSIVDLARPIAGVVLKLCDAFQLRVSRPEVAIHGSYFTGNVGDRAIGLVIQGRLREKGIESVLVSRFCSSPRPARVLIVGGGGVIHNHYKRNLYWRTQPVLETARSIYFAVGAPGFRELSDQEVQRLRILRGADHFSVRDRESAKILEDLIGRQILVAADPAWLFDHYLAKQSDVRSMLVRAIYNLTFSGTWAKDSELVQTKRERIGVALSCALNRKNLGILRGELTDLARQAALFFIPFSPKDVAFFRRHMTDIPNLSCFAASNPYRTFMRIRSMDRMIAMRYHSLIFSALARKPIIALAYARKVWSLAGRLRVRRVDFRETLSSLDLSQARKSDRRAVRQLVQSAHTSLSELEQRVAGYL